MNKLWKFITSIKLAVVLISILILLSIVGTLIPQDKDDGFYLEKYGTAAAEIIIKLHLHNFYRSLSFLIPLALFFINLLACSASRLYKRIKLKSPLRPGPDIIHLSLLLLIVAGVLMLFNAEPFYARLGNGDSFTLPDGTKIILETFKTEYYEDGRVSDWFSKVRVEGKESREEVIEVNKPLKVGSYRIYQSSYEFSPLVNINSNDFEQKLEPSEGISIQDGMLYFIDAQEKDGVKYSLFYFLENADDNEYSEIVLQVGQEFRGVSVSDIIINQKTILQISYQPISWFIYFTLFLFCFGLAITFYQKLGDIKE